MALSKRVRFEIFKRDGFTCQYCGQHPPEVVLEVDHVDPRAHGGSDEEVNLITSCFDCNRGKSDKRLGDVRPRPDVNEKFLETQQEIAEAKAYLDSKKVLKELHEKIIEHLEQVFEECINRYYLPDENQWVVWLSDYTPSQIENAVRRASFKHRKEGFSGTTGREQRIGVACYIGAILRNLYGEGQKGGKIKSCA